MTNPLIAVSLLIICASAWAAEPAVGEWRQSLDGTWHFTTNGKKVVNIVTPATLKK